MLFASVLCRCFMFVAMYFVRLLLFCTTDFSFVNTVQLFCVVVRA